jgi:hypothetical protein
MNCCLRPTDLPMVASVTRVRKHTYLVSLTFAQSKRRYDDLIVHARSKKLALASARKQYDNIVKVKR